MRFTSILLCLCCLQGFAQQDLKAIKKAVPLKGVKTVEPSGIAPNIFWYHSKTSKGLWDNERKKVLLQNVLAVTASAHNPYWLDYQTTEDYGVYDLKEARTLVSASGPFTQELAADTNMLLVIGHSVMGFIFKDRDTAHTVPTDPWPENKISFFYDESSWNGCSYDSASHTIGWSGYEMDGIQDYIILGHLDGKYLTEEAGGYLNSNKVFGLDSGKLVQNFYTTPAKWKNGYYVAGREYSYYDHDFNPILEYVETEDHSLEDFRTLFDTLIDKVRYVENGIYKIRRKGLYSFFSIGQQKAVTDEYDYVFEIGEDIYTNGYAYYLMHQGKFGLYNSWRGVELQPKYTTIEQRAFADGFFGYRADNELHPLGYSDIKFYEKKDSIPWDASKADSSMIIHHMDYTGGKVLLSFRHVQPDLHDSYYGTGNYYHMGSGVIDYEKQDWDFKPYYHTLTPYKEHYIAMIPGTSGHEWTETELLGKDFKSIDGKKWGVAFIYNGHLIIRNENWQLVDYDIEKQRSIKVLGKWTVQYEDWRFIDGHLFIGKNDFERYGSDCDLNIMHIIGPGPVLLPHYGFHWYKHLGNDLVMVGKIPKGKKLEDMQTRDGRFNPNETAIYDLRIRKIISPWYSSLFLDDYGIDVSISYFTGKGEDSKRVELPLDKIRGHYK